MKAQFILSIQLKKSDKEIMFSIGFFGHKSRSTIIKPNKILIQRLPNNLVISKLVYIFYVHGRFTFFLSRY